MKKIMHHISTMPATKCLYVRNGDLDIKEDADAFGLVSALVHHLALLRPPPCWTALSD